MDRKKFNEKFQDLEIIDARFAQLDPHADAGHAGADDDNRGRFHQASSRVNTHSRAVDSDLL